jgi:ribonuclease Z
MIDLALLGCGGSMPIPERHLTSLLINFQGKKVLIDCGEGTQVSMKVLAWGFKSIDIICITHAHLDHIIGLPGILATIRNSERTLPLTIIGPKGIRRIIQGLLVTLPYIGYELDIIEQPETIVMNENLTINTLKLDHNIPCLGYRFDLKRNPKFDVEKAIENQVPKLYWNRLQKGETIIEAGKEFLPEMVLGEDRQGIRISYITDTRPIESIPEFVLKSDLFICEGMYGSDDDIDKAIHNKHMTFREAATLAKEGAVGELILTHFSPKLLNPEAYIENATAVFRNTNIGFDRLVRTLNFKNRSTRIDD